MCTKNKETGQKDKCESRLEADKMLKEVEEIITEMDTAYELNNSGETVTEETPKEETKEEVVKSPYVQSCEPKTEINVEIRVTGNIMVNEPEDQYIETVKALMKAQIEIMDKAKSDPTINVKRFKTELIKFARESIQNKS